MKCVGNTEQWKRSPIDARDAMLLQTPSPNALWQIVRTNYTRAARLNLMHDILSRLRCGGKKKSLVRPDPDIASPFSLERIGSKRLAR